MMIEPKLLLQPIYVIIVVNRVGDIYVFIYENPWPPVSQDGLWKPWKDNIQGSNVSDNSSEVSVKIAVE